MNPLVPVLIVISIHAAKSYDIVNISGYVNIDIEAQNDHADPNEGCISKETHIKNLHHSLMLEMQKVTENIKKYVLNYWLSDQQKTLHTVSVIGIMLNRKAEDYLHKNGLKFKANERCIKKERWKISIDDYLKKYRGVIFSDINNILRQATVYSRADTSIQISTNHTENNTISNINETENISVKQKANYNASMDTEKKSNSQTKDDNGICEDFGICSNSQVISEFLDDIIRTMYMEATNQMCELFLRNLYEASIHSQNYTDSILSLLKNDTINMLEETMYNYLYVFRITRFKKALWKARKHLISKIYETDITNWQDIYPVTFRQLMIDVDDLFVANYSKHYDATINNFKLFTLGLYDHKKLINDEVDYLKNHLLAFPEPVRRKLKLRVAEMIEFLFKKQEEKQEQTIINWKEKIKKEIENKFPIIVNSSVPIGKRRRFQ